MSAAPPAPKFVLRGHQAAVHAAAFVRSNERLATGDSQGFVVLWDLLIMRARAVWKAHEGAVLGLRGWGSDKIITHGRDHKLIVWQLAEKDEGGMSTALPLDGGPAGGERPRPWILHLLEVNTMNFCSFAACPAEGGSSYTRFLASSSEILIAVPNTLASEAVDIYSLPSQKRTHTIKPGSSNGMAMSLSLLHHHHHHHHHQTTLTLIAGFENGYTSVHQLCPSTGAWTLTYRSQAHSQPILSLDVRPRRDNSSNDCFFTSGADAIIAKHPVPTAQQEWKHAKKVVNTRHSGQQSLEVRSDGRIFATAGWDSRVRVYSCKTMEELAVLRWHKEGAYAVTFSDVGPPDSRDRGRGGADADADADADAPAARNIDVSRLSISDRRSHRVKTAHWVAAGAKDGRVSLWDIY
ncbi:hypothetical protein E4U41_004383 [Claviceps citrina]|nr:hypothetical protein E4U41_004383 [Claviceps citrina]